MIGGFVCNTLELQYTTQTMILDAKKKTIKNFGPQELNVKLNVTKKFPSRIKGLLNNGFYKKISDINSFHCFSYGNFYICRKFQFPNWFK